MATDPLRDKLDQAADRADAASTAFYAVLTNNKETPVPVEGGTVDSMSKRIYDQVGAQIDAINAKADEAAASATSANASKDAAANSATQANSAKTAAEGARDTAAQAKDQAQTAAQASQASAVSAQSSASNSSNSASQAADSANTASTAANQSVQAKDAANVAKNAAQASEASAESSKNAAATSASNSASSEAAAKGYSEAALAYRDSSLTNANSAAASATQSAASASASLTSAQEAKTSATSAASANTSAQSSKDAAATSAASASQSATSAESSATVAGQKETGAISAANSAEASKTQAQSASSSAQGFAAQAQASATEASGYLGDVEQSASDASVSATAAQDSKDAAGLSATAAQGSATSAASSASAAATSAQEAAASVASIGSAVTDAQAAAQDAESSATAAQESATQAANSAASITSTVEFAQYTFESESAMVTDGTHLPDGAIVYLRETGKTFEKSGNTYIPQIATNPIRAVLSYDTYAEAQLAAATLPDGQVVEVQKTGARFASEAGALNIIDAISNEYEAISEALTAELQPFSECIVQGTTFKVVKEPPKTACIPVLASKHGYLIPASDHVSRRFGGVLSRGSITNTDDFKFTSGGTRRSCQGMEFDARKGTVILVSLNNDTSSPEHAKFIEYVYSPEAGIGAEIMRTSDIPVGHGEDFAVVYDGDNRFIWSRDGDNKGIVKISFVPNASSAQIVQRISLASLAQTAATNVSVYDDQHLIVKYWDMTWNWVAAICKISDLDSGNFLPVRFIGLTNGPGTLSTHEPAQNLKAIGNEWAGISGYQAVSTYQANVGWWSENTGLLGRTALNTATTAETVSEPESIAHWWNQETLKYETVTSVWYINEGRVNLYSTNSPNGAARFQQSGNPFLKEQYTADLLPWNNTSQPRIRWMVPSTLGASSLQIGGERRQLVGGVFDPQDFAIYQWTQIQADGREEAVINFKNQRIQISGANDPVLGPTARYYLSLTNGDAASADEVFHVYPWGIRLGTSLPLSSTSPRFGVHVQPRKAGDGGVYVPELATPANPSFVGSSWGLTFGTTYTDMFLGQFTPATKARTVWWRLNGERIRPEIDNASDIGFSSYRIKNMYLSNSPIVTSDEREKEQWRDQSESERLAAIEIKSAIKAYKFSKSVRDKGDSSARWRFGIGAQTVGDILRAHGLNPSDYAFWCYDEWGEQREIKDEEGNITQEYQDAGNRYGIRYDELCMFILSSI